MKGIGCRSGWNAMVLAAGVIAGCQNGATENPGGRATLLTGIEMDQVSAGSAVAMNEVEALALGAAPQTTTFASTLANFRRQPDNRCAVPKLRQLAGRCHLRQQWHFRPSRRVEPNPNPGQRRRRLDRWCRHCDRYGK